MRYLKRNGGSMHFLIFLFPLISLAAPELDHADLEANLIREARIKERQYRAEALQEEGGFEALLRSCKYVSSISTPPPRNRVALTFDDGPDAFGTPFVLDVLRKYKLKATFFMKGSSATARPALVQRVLDEGHMIVGNHSWSHRDFHKLSLGEQSQEVIQTQRLLSQYQEQKFFRYPFGNSTCQGNDLIHSRGYKIVGWHVDSCDWGFNKTGAVSKKDAEICEVRPENTENFVGHVLQQVQSRRGGIILMHDIQPNTIQKLEKIIEGLQRLGFSFGTLDESGFAPSMR